jgi:hypothetical protein
LRQLENDLKEARIQEEVRDFSWNPPPHGSIPLKKKGKKEEYIYISSSKSG